MSYLDLVVSDHELANKKQVGSKNLFFAEYKTRDVYLSYKTIIAEKVDGKWNFTDKKYSVTTSKHVSSLKKTLGV